MTNREALISLLGFQPDKNAIDRALIDADVIAATEYDGSNKITLKTIAVELMELILTTPDTWPAEGTRIEFDRKAVEARIRQYKIDLGIIEDDSVPTITNKSYMW